MTNFKRKIKKGYVNVKAFLENPDTKKKFLKGTSTFSRVSHEWEEGIDKTIGVPRHPRENTLVGMEHGVVRALPQPRKRTLDRVVVRRPSPGTVEKFW